jgi:hypothetical protein
MTRLPVVAFIAIVFLTSCDRINGQELISPDKVHPVKLGLAENDYSQKRPFLDGLELGFRAFEADIFLTGGRLMVGASVLDLNAKGTFEELYLAPLQRIHQGASDLPAARDEPITLFIDIRSAGRQVYAELKPLLEKYASLLTSVKDDMLQTGFVTVILTGDVPRELIVDENPRLVAIDGHVADIESSAPSHLIPVISVRWASYFRWDGRTTPFLENERKKLHSMSEYVHEHERKFRLRSTPDLEIVWAALQAANVDYIGAETYVPLNKFLTPPPSPFEREKPD